MRLDAGDEVVVVTVDVLRAADAMADRFAETLPHCGGGGECEADWSSAENALEAYLKARRER